MMHDRPIQPAGPAGARPALQRILIVDDSRLQRRILISALKNTGYIVEEADSAEAALEACARRMPDMILSDWMMPGMTGVDLCRAVRGIQAERYVYFIILTSKSEKGELASALQQGADDFLTKPISSDELRGRIAAGERILRMERELTEKNRLVTQTLTEMQALNAVLDRDLLEARKLQMSLVPRGTLRMGPAAVSFLLQPSGHVGGDLVGRYGTGTDRIGVFALDVSGHGIASALITARLSAWLSGDRPDQNAALMWQDDRIVLRPPDQIAARLNRMFMAEIETEHYFTIVLAQIELATGAVELCLAGHPPPIVQRVGGATELVGTGGMPVGLMAEAEYEVLKLRLRPGDRLMLYSDGLSECPLPEGGMLEEEGVQHLMRRHADICGAGLFEALKWELSALTDDRDLPDDVSGALLEYGVEPPGQGM
ncbi:response regulator [Oceaniovalibus guishaninsula JLT2003]|uniref:Response regulator n=2 Tax=Oceaniovalibus TaxID=1207070 RepID=K2GPU7_9RHOB|nr:response regulator [Oceaniovalibus guishaninsula JLT2003]